MVEKLSKTIQELEESSLASGVAVNAVCDYQRQISELFVRFLPITDEKQLTVGVIYSE